MNEKKIEPTQAMVDIVERADKLMVMDTRDLLRYALNHPDAPGLFADEDDLPWEPLSKDDPPRVGDEVRREAYGLTTTAVVGVVGGEDKDGCLWTADGGFIGSLGVGTWYVRRAALEIPPERDGAVLVPADGHKAITTTDGQEFSRLTFTTKQSIWYGPNLAGLPGDLLIQAASPSRLTPGTWKVADQ